MEDTDHLIDRRPPRIDVSLPLTVREDIIDSPRITGLLSKDLSTGGMAIEIHDKDLSAKLLDGRLPGLWIEIQLPGRSRPEMVMARKMWGKDIGDGKFFGGFKFLGFAEDAQKRIYDTYTSSWIRKPSSQRISRYIGKYAKDRESISDGLLIYRRACRRCGQRDRR